MISRASEAKGTYNAKNVWLALIPAAVLFGCIWSSTDISSIDKCPKATYFRPVWSADGTSIYYEWDIYLPTQEESEDDGVRVIDTDGKNDRLLYKWARPGQLSPDGKMMLYIPGGFYAVGAYDYKILDLATLQTRELLTRRSGAVWSPDSQWILSASEREDGSLTKTNALTGESIDLTDGRSKNSWPLWSLDGKTILFQSDMDNDLNSFYTMDASGGAITRTKISAPAACASPHKYGGDFLLSVLPDGKTLATQYECNYYTRLRTIGLDGTEVNDLSGLGYISESVTNEIEAKWSPDGTKILFIRFNDGNLTVADPDGTHVRVLRDSDVYSFAWSPDSSRVAFAGEDAAGLSEIFTVRPDGTDLQQVTQNPYIGQTCP